MSEQVSFVDPVVEETAVAYALKDTATLQESAQTLDSSLFEDRRYRALFDAARSYYDRFQGVIDSAGLEAMLDEGGQPVDRKTAYHVLFSGLKTRNISRPQFLLAIQQLQKLKQKRKLYDIATQIAASLKDPNLDITRVTGDITTKILGLEDVGTTVFREASLKATIDSRLAEYKDREINPSKYLGIPFGIKALDDLTGGTFPEEFTLFFGRSGAGKSRTLASTAYNMFNHGYNVMYVTIEMPMGQVGRLFDSRHFLVSAGGLRHGRLNEADRTKYLGQNNLANLPGDFYVVDAPQGCSFSTLLPIIRKYKARHKLDVVVVDYLNLMSASAKGADNNESLRIGTIGKELKMLARLERIAVLSASQATRSTAEVDDIEDVGTEHVSWSDLIAYQCDLIVFLKKGDATGTLAGAIDGLVVKYRDGSNQKISLRADWDHTFVGDTDQYLRLIGAVTA